MALSSTKISCASPAGAGNQSNLFLSSLYRCGATAWSAEMIKPSRIFDKNAAIRRAQE
jgi:hypothetical protein